MLTILNPESFDWENMSISECIRGNAWDTYFTLKIFRTLKEELEKQDRWNLIENLVMPLTPDFAEIEYNGVDVSLKALDEVGKDLQDRNTDDEDRLYEYKEVSQKYNVGSNDDIVKILFTDEKGFQMYPSVFTEEDNPSVNEECLKNLLEDIEEEMNKRSKNDN